MIKKIAEAPKSYHCSLSAGRVENSYMTKPMLERVKGYDLCPLNASWLLFTDSVKGKGDYNNLTFS